jgi:hypothetical protein
MPYSVALNSQHQYVESRYSGDVTLEDIQATNLQIVQCFDESQAEKLRVLTDVADVKSQPMQIAQIWNSTRHVAYHPKFDTWVIVGIHNPVLKFVIDMVIRLAKIPYQKFNNREEALAFLMQPVSEQE